MFWLSWKGQVVDLSWFLCKRECNPNTNLSTFSSDTSGQLDVLGHDGDTLGMDGAQVSVFKESNQVGFAGFLQCHDGWALEPQVSLEILCNLSHETLEWQFPDEELSALLVPPDLTEGDGSRPVSVWFLDSTGSWCRLASGFGCQLLTWGLASSGFTSGLLCTSHCSLISSVRLLSNNDGPTRSQPLYIGSPAAWQDHSTIRACWLVLFQRKRSDWPVTGPALPLSQSVSALRRRPSCELRPALLVRSLSSLVCSL